MTKTLSVSFVKKEFMKQILVPFDFSDTSREAFKMALNVSERTGAYVTLLHVIFIPTYADPNLLGEPMLYNATFSDEMQKEADAKFVELTKELGPFSGKVHFEVIFGDILLSILKIIEKNKIDLVLMGASGASGLRGVFIGSNTEKMVRHSNVPVLVVKKALNLNMIKSILLPTTTGLNQKEFMDSVKGLQKMLGAKLHVLFINTPSHFRSTSEGMELLRDFVKFYELHDYELHFENEFVEDEGIVKFASKHKADLIVMGTHARKGLAHLFNGSVTEDVVRQIEAPIWTSKLN